MRDHPDPSTGSKSKAQLLQNVYPFDSEVGGGLVGRPGYVELVDDLGALSKGQRVFQFTKEDETELLVAFSGGEMYEVDLAGASTTLLSHTVDADAIVACLIFTDGLVISDGVSSPTFATHNTGTGVWTFTPMPNCPALYGQPTVRNARILGIREDERNAFVWSEVNDPFTGYESGGYNNAWKLVQTDQEGLVAVVGTNDALYYWRSGSIGAIYGDIVEDWINAGTTDSISPTVGTKSPWAVVRHEDSFYFPDADGVVQRLVIGGGVQVPEPGLDARYTVRALPKSELEWVMGVYWKPADLVLFAYPRLVGESPEVVLTFAAKTGIFSGVWKSRGRHMRTLDVVKDLDGTLSLLTHTTEDGKLCAWGKPDGEVWSDAGEAIEHAVYGSALGWSENQTWKFVRADLIMQTKTRLSAMQFSIGVPEGRNKPMSVSGGSNAPKWGAVEWGAFQWASDSDEQHIPIEFVAEGRWCQLRFKHAGLDEQFGLTGWVVDAFPMGPTATAR